METKKDTDEIIRQSGIYLHTIERCQSILASYIVPDSGVSDQEVIGYILGVLDEAKLVVQIRECDPWIRYAADLKRHNELMFNLMPKRMFYQNEEEYKKDLSNWEMASSCDAPNKPGYYRANND